MALRVSKFVKMKPNGYCSRELMSRGANTGGKEGTPLHVSLTTSDKLKSLQQYWSNIRPVLTEVLLIVTVGFVGDMMLGRVTEKLVNEKVKEQTETMATEFKKDIRMLLNEFKEEMNNGGSSGAGNGIGPKDGTSAERGIGPKDGTFAGKGIEPKDGGKPV